MILQLETALEKTKKNGKRLIVEGQEDLGTLGVMEIEDQISSPKSFQTATSVTA